MRFVWKSFVALALCAPLSYGARAQNPEDFFKGMGRIVQSGIRAAIQAEWEKIPTTEVACIDQRLKEAGGSINSVVGQGIGPSDNRIAAIRNACHSPSALPNMLAGPSFDCGVASRTDEVAVCSDKELSRLDRIVAAGYEYLRGRYGDNVAQSVAAPLLKQRHACGSDIECIRRTQTATITAFQARGAPVQAMSQPSQSGLRNGVVYTVDGLQLGSRVVLDSPVYREYSCTASNQFSNFTWCQRKRLENLPRGQFNSSNTILHSPDGTAFYINRYLEPAFFAGNEANDDINRLSIKFGTPTTMPLPPSAGTSGIIAYWGGVSLTPLEAELTTQLLTGKDLKAGLLIDHIGNFQRSAQLGLPIYRLGGTAGYVWAASWGNDGRGTLRFLAIDASRIPAALGSVSEVRKAPQLSLQDDASSRTPDKPPLSTPLPSSDGFAARGPASDSSTPIASGGTKPGGDLQEALSSARPPAAEKPEERVQASSLPKESSQNSADTRPTPAPPEQAEASTRPEIRVVGPPALPKPTPSEPAGSNALVVFLIAAIGLLLVCVAFLLKKTRSEPKSKIAAISPSGIIVSDGGPIPKTEPAIQTPADSIGLLSPLVTEDNPSSIHVGTKSVANDGSRSGWGSKRDRPIEIVDRSHNVLSSFAMNGWAWAGGAILLATVALAPYGVVAFAPIALAAYLLPSIIAFRRKHLYAWFVLALNLFFGLTGLVWLAMLIWALTGIGESPLDSMQADSGVRLSESDKGIVNSERDLQSGWRIPVVQAELFAFHSTGGPLIAGPSEVKAYLKNPVIGLFVKSASSAATSFRYDVKTDVRCVAPLSAETKVRVGRTIGRSALTGLGAAIFTGRHAALGGAILDYRFAGDETEDVVSALMVFSDFSSLVFQCSAIEYDKFCALMPQNVLSEERADETGDQLARIRRMADDGPRVLVEADQFIATAKQQVESLTAQTSSGPTFADRDRARLELAQATAGLRDAEAVRKAVRTLILPQPPDRLRSA
jgi:Superinfection immunity protein